MTTANQIARGKLRDENVELRAQKEDLINRVAMHELNAKRMNLVIGCLVKRLGAVLADRTGWRVIVTDEEVEVLEGELDVRRSEEAAGIILTVLKPEEVSTG